MKNLMKKITVTVVTVGMLTGFAQAEERTFKSSVAEDKVMKIMTQSTQSDGWDVVKKSDDKQFIIGKAYTKRVVVNHKPVKRVKSDLLVELSFTENGYTLQAVNEEGKAQNSLSYKEERIFSNLKTAIEKHLASSLI